jgi:hypothetical protein
MVGSLFSWKSLLTKRMTSEDCDKVSLGPKTKGSKALYTFPTAASPSRTSLTLLLGFGCAEASAIVML